MEIELMGQTPFQGDIAYDWQLWVGRHDGETITWTQVRGFEDLPTPDQVPEDVDVTHMQSPGRVRETIPGLLPVADWSQEKQLWPDDPGDVLLFDLSKKASAGEKEDVEFEFYVPVGETPIRMTYRGYVNSYIPTGSVGDKAMATLSVKIMERREDNDRVIA